MLLRGGQQLVTCETPNSLRQCLIIIVRQVVESNAPNERGNLAGRLDLKRLRADYEALGHLELVVGNRGVADGSHFLQYLFDRQISYIGTNRCRYGNRARLLWRLQYGTGAIGVAM